jgi:hypothetical protein
MNNLLNDKINKTCSNVYLIDQDFCLSESLSVINLNFNNLKTQYDFILKYADEFESFYNLFLANSSVYFDTLTQLNQFSALWDSANLTISQNYQNWNNSPIYLLYPNLINFDFWYDNNNIAINQIKNWIEKNFPAADFYDDQKINISINLIRDQETNFNFEKSYYEDCHMYGIKTENCEKCTQGIKTCCNTDDLCIDQIEQTTHNFINRNQSYTTGKLESNPFSINFLNQNFDLNYGAFLKAGTNIKGKLKIDTFNFDTGVLQNDIMLPVKMDKRKKTLYLDYILETNNNGIVELDLDLNREVSPGRSTNISAYVKDQLLHTKTIDVQSSLYQEFKTSENFPKNRYRIEYEKGAMSYWNDGNIWTPGLNILVKSGSKNYEFGTGYCCLGQDQAEDVGKNYYGPNQPFFVEFEHDGGEISLYIGDSAYGDNRALNGIGPTFKLFSMKPVYLAGVGDGTYEMTNLTNPFAFPANFKFVGKIDNQIFINGTSYSGYKNEEQDVNIEIKNVGANQNLKIELKTNQDILSLGPDYAKIKGKVTWTSTQPIPQDLSFNGNIDWYVICETPEYGNPIPDCNACNNCNVVPDDKTVTLTCGKISGGKELNINFIKTTTDRSIYRIKYATFLNQNKQWNYIN